MNHRYEMFFTAHLYSAVDKRLILFVFTATQSFQRIVYRSVGLARLPLK